MKRAIAMEHPIDQIAFGIGVWRSIFDDLVDLCMFVYLISHLNLIGLLKFN